jgi:Tat protein translocase TatB subunit
MLSFPEILVILLVAVVVLGPKRLPETARKLGHWVGLFKRASEEFKRELMSMDRVVDDTLNRAVSDIDQLVPDEVAPPADVDLADLMGIPAEPPLASPDDVWDTPPVPGGLAPEPTVAPAESAVQPEAPATPKAPQAEVKEAISPPPSAGGDA